jgi:hypothetical protein
LGLKKVALSFGSVIFISYICLNQLKQNTMRKFTIAIYGKSQTIIAETKELALEQAKVNLGYQPTDVVINWTQEWFSSVDDLIARCEITKKHFGDKAIEIVELWTPIEIKTNCGHIEILRTDNYYDSIFFEPYKLDLLKQTYKQLEKYNREITPLEKYHASF